MKKITTIEQGLRALRNGYVLQRGCCCWHVYSLSFDRNPPINNMMVPWAPIVYTGYSALSAIRKALKGVKKGEK